MAKYKTVSTTKFRKDLKLAKRRGLQLNLLRDVVTMLTEGEPLPSENRDHELVGNYKGFRECHIQPDWLLIYKKGESLKIISLERTGTHSNLFGKK